MDVGHLPTPMDVQVFQRNYLQSGSAQLGNVWQRPRGCQCVYALLVGPGGNGGAGFSGATSTQRGGGGGGGGGAVIRFLIPAPLLPETLIVRVGGQGGGSDFSAIYAPNHAMAIAQAGYGLAGGTGTATTGGTAGTAGYATVNRPYRPLMYFVNGATGGAGNASGAAGSVTQSTIAAPGAGGAGVSAANAIGNGGSQNTTRPPFFSGPLSTVAGDGLNGPNGVTSWLPGTFLFLSRGGCGGNSSAAGTGGKGGDGGIGAGGGGGGGGVTGGAGGAGGPGIVIIASW